MTTEERLDIAKKKLVLDSHKRILRENREKSHREKIDVRRKIIIGNLFMRYFPEASGFSPGLTNEETESNFESLKQLMMALAECWHSYHDIECYLGKTDGIDE